MSDTTRRNIFILLLLAASAAAMGATSYTGAQSGITDWLGVFTGLATGAAFLSFGVVLAFAIDKWLFLDLNTWEQINKGNVAMAIWAAVLLFAVLYSMTRVQVAMGQHCYQPAPEPSIGSVVIDTAAGDLGRVEQPPNSNEGPLPRQCLAHVGLDEGYPYCAACVSLWVDEAGADYPTKDGKPLRSASTKDFRTADCAIKPGKVIRGEVTPDSGAIPIWQKGNGPYGHAAALEEMTSLRCFVTIEANTTPPDGEGSQREGGGVYRRHRCFNVSSYFSVTRVILPPSQCESA